MRVYAAVARPAVGGYWRRVYRFAPRTTAAFTFARTTTATYPLSLADDLRAWADKHGLILRTWAVEVYPWVRGDLAGLDPVLLASLNRVGARLRRIVFVRSGNRTYEEQAALYRAYLAGTGALAARPGTSNHEGGRAADCQLDDRNGPNIGAVSAARVAMRTEGLCLPVPGEAWHVERGTSWAA